MKQNLLMERRQKVVKEMLMLIGEDPSRDGLKDTPLRVAKMWNEIFGGYHSKNKPIITVFNNGSDGIVYDQMACDTGRFYSNCEHHMLPIIGSYYFGVVYNPQGKILGLSKVARVVDYFATRLQVQERLGHQIVKELWNRLEIPNDIGDRPGPNKKKEPLAMGLVLEAKHLCKSMRGVKKDGMMRTTILKGTFKTDIAARAEFIDWVNSNGR